VPLYLPVFEGLKFSKTYVWEAFIYDACGSFFRYKVFGATSQLGKAEISMIQMFCKLDRAKQNSLAEIFIFPWIRANESDCFLFPRDLCYSKKADFKFKPIVQ
jgi:hypothetical protein